MKKYILFILLAAFSFSCQYSTDKDKPKAKTEPVDVTQVSPEDLKYTIIDVDGMTCTGCENSIEKGVTELSGIVEVKASHKEGKATVTYDSSKITIQEIESAIDNKGYDVKGHQFVEGKAGEK